MISEQLQEAIAKYREAGRTLAALEAQCSDLQQIRADADLALRELSPKIREAHDAFYNVERDLLRAVDDDDT